RIPQRHQPRAQRVDFRLRQPGGVAARGAERRRRIELRSGRGVALRIALVEQRRDLVGVEFGLLLNRLLRRQRLRLGLGLLFLFLLLLSLLGARGWRRQRLRLRRFFRRGLELFFLGELGRNLFGRLRVGDFFHQRLGDFELGRLLGAL